MSVGVITTEVKSLENPIDLVEEIVVANDWAYERPENDEIMVQVTGQWCDYRLFFLLHPQTNALYFSSLLDIKIDQKKTNSINALLTNINERLWVGYFTVCSEERMPMYRHTLLLPAGQSPGVEQLEDLLDVALNECERFYPAFQLVLWGGRSPEDALTAAMLEPVGTA